METENLLQELAKPFSPEHISWKPGSLTKDNSKCMALAYADLRAYQDRLDEVCGLDWSCRFVPWTNNRIICELTIAGVTRSSTGESNAQDEKNGMAGSVAEAMAYKRACAAFGCGRFLYDLPSVWIEFDAQAKRISKAGQAELDKRYQDWYKRATGRPAPDPVPVAAHTNGPLPSTLGAQKAAAAQNGHEAGDNPFLDENDDSEALAPATAANDAPSQAELTIIGDWSTPADAHAWAVEHGHCENAPHAQKRFANVVREQFDNKLNKENMAAAMLAFLRACTKAEKQLL